MCQTHALSDCVLRVPSEIVLLKGSAPTHRRGQIQNIQALTHDVLYFELWLSDSIRFEAGQFVLIKSAGIAGARAYSMVNFDHSSECLSLVLKRKFGGKFSDWLLTTHQRGLDLETKYQGSFDIEVFGPLGRAVFRPDEDRDIVCIAGGSGIAGMMAILERAHRADYFLNHKATVFFGVRTLVDTFFLERLSDYVAAAYGRLAVTIALSEESPSTSTHAEYPAIALTSGMVHEVATKDISECYDNALVYLAGPPVMVNAAMRALIIAGIAIGNIRYDKFA
jgi:toluene monooxygenase electron transfer component